MYQFKQDLAMAYFDGCSKKTASRLLAREINLTPGLLDALRPTGYRPAQKRVHLQKPVSINQEKSISLQNKTRQHGCCKGIKEAAVTRGFTGEF